MPSTTEFCLDGDEILRCAQDDCRSAITLAKAASAMASISALVRFWMGCGT